MRISHRLKFIFFSKPRCASTSIRKILDPYADILSTDKHPFHHHVTALILKKYFKENDYEWDNYFKFITIRNPWEMIVSLFHYGKPDVNGLYFWVDEYNGLKRDATKLIPFNDWIIRTDIVKSWHYYAFQNGQYLEKVWTNDFSFYTIGNFIQDEEGNILVNEIIKVEELNCKMSKIFKKIGINEADIPSLNRTEHVNYRHYYTKETMKIIEDQFKTDIEIGKYLF